MATKKTTKNSGSRKVAKKATAAATAAKKTTKNSGSRKVAKKATAAATAAKKTLPVQSKKKSSGSAPGTATKKTGNAASPKAAPLNTGKGSAKKVASTKDGKRATKAPAASPTEVSSLVGKKAPSFTLEDQHGNRVTSAGLKGKAYVLYFYPKDNTPGCTKEACAFRDEQRNFLKSGVTVLGVSPDSSKSHAGFASKYELPFSLLADPDKTLASAYGVWALKKNYGREYMGIVRSTFLVGKNGKVQKEWRNVRVAGHVEEVLSEAKA